MDKLFFIPQEYRVQKRLLFEILKWTLIGLLIRIIIMPFTWDADAIKIYYLQYRVIAHGNWDIYTFVKANFGDWVIPTRNPYYPPLAIYIQALFQFVFQKFTPTLGDWLTHYESWLKGGAGYALGHVSLGGSSQLFRNIFVLKVPLLFFDFGIGLMLLHLINRINIKSAAFVYKLWMLNPFVLYGAYMSAQIDIYPLFFVMLALILSIYKRPYLAMASLSMGVLTKTYPLLLMPIALLYLGKDFRERLKLLFSALLPMVIFYLPSLITSRGYYLFGLYHGGSIGTGTSNKVLLVMKVLFVLSYCCLMVHIYFAGKNKCRGFALRDYFFLTTLLLFVSQPIGVRYYIWLTPLLFLEFTRNDVLWKVALFQALALVALRLCSQNLWLGLFAPLDPAFFMSLPIPDSFIAPLINVYYIHSFMYRLFIILTLYMIFRTIRNLYAQAKTEVG